MPGRMRLASQEGQTSLHPNINGQQDRHGVYPSQRNQGMLDIKHARML
jgi:hypothetical protein